MRGVHWRSKLIKFSEPAPTNSIFLSVYAISARGIGFCLCDNLSAIKARQVYADCVDNQRIQEAISVYKCLWWVFEWAGLCIEITRSLWFTNLPLQILCAFADSAREIGFCHWDRGRNRNKWVTKLNQILGDLRSVWCSCQVPLRFAAVIIKTSTINAYEWFWYGRVCGTW